MFLKTIENQRIQIIINISIDVLFVENIIFDDLIYQIFIKYGRKLRFPYSNPEHDDAIYMYLHIFFLLDSLINLH